MTAFATIINAFLGKVTDDMYLELTEEDTIRDAKQYLLDAIPYFEFPRFPLYDYDTVQNRYNVNLTTEEINILAILMKTVWLDRQISSVENVRMKYSGSDFKFTSQANHLAKLLALKTENLRESIHAQRLYKRRRTEDGYTKSNWAVFNTGVYYGIDTSKIKNDPAKEDNTWVPITSRSASSPVGYDTWGSIGNDDT